MRDVVAGDWLAREGVGELSARQELRDGRQLKHSQGYHGLSRSVSLQLYLPARNLCGNSGLKSEEKHSLQSGEARGGGGNV